MPNEVLSIYILLFKIENSLCLLACGKLLNGIQCDYRYYLGKVFKTVIGYLLPAVNIGYSIYFSINY